MLGPQQTRIDPNEVGLSWPAWAAKRVNDLFLTQGKRGERGNLLPKTLAAAAQRPPSPTVPEKPETPAP